jgi:hypothetical protein
MMFDERFYHVMFDFLPSIVRMNQSRVLKTKRPFGNARKIDWMDLFHCFGTNS